MSDQTKVPASRRPQRLRIGGTRGPVCAAALGAALAAALALMPGGARAQARFVANGAEVRDTVNGLVWRRCSEGQTWTGSTCSGNATNYTWQRALSRAQTAGAPWRLPDVKELASIVDDQRESPSIDTAMFPNTPSTYYWTSTHYEGSAALAWNVGFSEGNVEYVGRGNARAVRLVRVGQ